MKYFTLNIRNLSCGVTYCCFTHRSNVRKDDGREFYHIMLSGEDRNSQLDFSMLKFID